MTNQTEISNIEKSPLPPPPKKPNNNKTTKEPKTTQVRLFFPG